MGLAEFVYGVGSELGFGLWSQLSFRVGSPIGLWFWITVGGLGVGSQLWALRCWITVRLWCWVTVGLWSLVTVELWCWVTVVGFGVGLQLGFGAWL